MNSGPKCGECGAVISAGSPAGLCGKCLLSLGLDGAPAPNVSLPAPVLDTLAEAEARAQSLLAPPEVTGPEGTVLVSGLLTEKPGDRIGRYKLLQEIGEGGMGVVYMAEQEEPVRRRVALKIIKLGMDTRQVVARFEAERQALALMDHPNIAHVLDGGATDTGRPYFVMELVQGAPITEFCDKNKLPARERLGLFIQVCQAIQSAHQKGIIHRDIKPSNILVTLHHSAPMPKVIDFGIAKAINQKLTEKTLFTNYATMIGTPAYMSPEQAEMSSMDVDTRTDVYALGVLLYELLTGSTPFPEKRLRSLGYGEMQRVIVEEEPERPSTRLSTMAQEQKSIVAKNRGEEFASLSRILRGDLDWVVMKCLEKDRRRRYDTANALAMDITRHLTNEPVVARPPGQLYRFQKLARRNKGVFAAAAVVVVVLFLGVIVSTWQAVRATRSQQNEAKQRRIADEARQNEAQLRRRAEAQELAARQIAYASDINLAQQALALNNLGHAQMLLNRQRPQSGQPDLRGWEWRYLWQQCRSDALFTLCQETNQIGSLAVSHDGKWMAVCDRENGGLSIWDLQTRRAAVRLPAGGDQVRAAFSPRDKLLAFTVSSARKSAKPCYGIRLWNTETRETVADLPVQSFCMGLAFSGDGRTLVTTTAGDQGRIELWRIPDGKNLASYPAPQAAWEAATPFAVAQDMSVAAHATPGDKVRVIDLASGRERWSAKAAQEGVKALALSPDGKILASGAGFTESAIRLWDVASGQEVNRLSGHRFFIAALMFWPDGKTLASASGDQTIRLWDISNPRNVPPPRVLRGHKLEVWRLALLPDTVTLVSGGKDGSVCFWDTTSSRQENARIILPGTFSSWRFDPESKSVATLARNGNVVRWSGASFQEMEPVYRIDPDFDAYSTLFSADTRLLAAGSKQGRIRVWDLPQRALLRDWTNGISPQPCAFLRDGQRLVTVDRGDGIHREWDLATWKETQSWRQAGDLLWSCNPAFSPDERWCLTLNYGGTGLIRDMTTSSDRDASLSVQHVMGATFSPDGKLFAAATDLGPAKLFETAKFQEIATLRGVFQGICSVAFSPDSKRLALGGGGIEAIKLWNVESLQELLTLEGEGSFFYRTTFSPDGNVLGSMNEQGVLHLWRAPSWDEIDAAEKMTERKTQ